MKLQQRILTFLAVVSLGVATFSGVTPLRAQAPQSIPALPLDTAVRMGKLPNGLSYFIRHNAEPQARAEFYIVQRVGSMQEEDSQRGLAHFLEHIAFNGTKHFPGKGIDHFLEGIGASFGSNINAYTSFDETVYTLMNIPVPRKSVVDSCILILHDWSNSLSLEDKEIDAERGVIEEEWRSRDSGDARNQERLLELTFPGNKYGQRMPIGKMDIVRNFPYQVLRDYYKKWYRPDQQALVIVGDINVDEVEASIKRLFADIPAPVGAAERVYVPVENNDKPIVAIASDPEATQNLLSITYKQEVTPPEIRASILGVATNYVKHMITAMANERFGDITQKPNAPFLGASMDIGPLFGLAKTKDATGFGAAFKEGAWEPALKALTAEMVRIKKYGFNKSEYERARKDYLVNVKKLYNERNKRKNKAWAEEYVSYFTDGGTLMDIPSYYDLISKMSEQITLEQINGALAELLTEDNLVLMLSSVKKDGVKIPTEAEFLAAYETGIRQQVEPLKEAVSDQKLLDKLPMKGKVVKVLKDQKYGSTVWTLSNGVRVVLKKTDYKEDEILMSAQRGGGILSMTASPLDKKLVNQLSDLGGLGKFDVTALGKALAGRIASVSTNVSNLYDDISGSSSKEDLETMLQLLYLSITAPRADQEAFKTWQEQTLAGLQAAKANPLSSLGDSVSRLLYPKNPERYPLTEAEVKEANYQRVLKLHHSHFATAEGFTYYFVGNIDEATLRPLVERYIASLPVKKGVQHKAPYDKAVREIPGTHTKVYSKEMATPTGIAVNSLSVPTTSSHKGILIASTLSSILDQLYTKTIREDEGGTYGVSANVSLGRYPQPYYSMTVQFQTEPSKVEKLNALVFHGLEDIAKNGPSQDYFDKAIKNMEKEHSESLRRNGYWLSQLHHYYGQGLDLVTDFDQVRKSITPAEVQALAKQLIEAKNRITIYFKSIEPKK